MSTNSIALTIIQEGGQYVTPFVKNLIPSSIKVEKDIVLATLTAITTATGAATVTAVLPNTSALRIGQRVTAAGVPAGTTVLAITGTGTFTLSANASASATVAATVNALEIIDESVFPKRKLLSSNLITDSKFSA